MSFCWDFIFLTNCFNRPFCNIMRCIYLQMTIGTQPCFWSMESLQSVLSISAWTNGESMWPWLVLRKRSLFPLEWALFVQAPRLWRHPKLQSRSKSSSTGKTTSSSTGWEPIGHTPLPFIYCTGCELLSISFSRKDLITWSPGITVSPQQLGKAIISSTFVRSSLICLDLMTYFIWLQDCCRCVGVEELHTKGGVVQRHCDSGCCSPVYR